jgi:hypothetical protein
LKNVFQEKLVTTFATSAPTVDRSDALQTAITTLTNNGFAITHRDAASASLTGPGLYSTKQNPILGATKVLLSVHNKSLNAEAELGGVDAMQRFLTRFPLLLGLGLGTVLGVVGGYLFGQQFGVGFGVPWAQGWKWMLLAIGVAMLPVSPWLFISPLISRMIRRRTQNALETLVRNASYSSRPV